MDVERQFERFVDSIGNTDAPREEHRRQLRRQVLATVESSGTSASVIPGLNTRRSIMSNALIRWPAATAALSGRRVHTARRWALRAIVAGAAAATIVIAMLVGLTPNPGPQGSAYAELIQAVENARKAQWTHFLEMDGSENWVSFKPFLLFSKKDGKVTSIDKKANVQQEYDPDTKTLTLSLPTLGDRLDTDADNMLDAIVHRIEDPESGVKVVKSTEKINGRDTTVYTVTFKEDKKERTLRLFVDPEKKRWIGGEDWNKKTFEVDYPEKGPADIYALGVPKDAKVVDKRKESAQKIVQTATEKRKSRAAAEERKKHFAAKLKELGIDTADLKQVKKVFGEPDCYYANNKSLPGDTASKDLPNRFSVVYGDNLQVQMVDGGKKVVELTCTQPGYFFAGKIQVGSSLDEVIEVVGRPQETVKGGKLEFKDGVLYKNVEIGKAKGVTYYSRSDKCVRFWIENDKVAELDITRGSP